MPPAYIYRLETGPRMISQYGPFISYQANVDANGQNILGDAANEPSIAVSSHRFGPEKLSPKGPPGGEAAPDSQRVEDNAFHLCAESVNRWIGFSEDDGR